jgi:predicted amidohydrolase YtcJ
MNREWRRKRLGTIAALGVFAAFAALTPSFRARAAGNRATMARSCVAPKEAASLALVNGEFYTVNPAESSARAVAVRDGKILAVGSNAEIRGFVGRRTRVIDLHGKFAMPGFNEAHVGTDDPVEPINPMGNLRACVTRETPQRWPNGGWEPQQKISMDDCLHGYTTGSAYAEFAGKTKGELKPGMFADIVVLSHDPRKNPPTELWRTKALLTIVGGRIVYDRMPVVRASR